MRKFGTILLVFCFIAKLFCMPAFGQEVSSENNYDGIEAARGIIDEKVVTNAKSAIVFERNSGTIMYADNIDEKLYPASFVKIMTALLAIEQGTLSETVTVTKSALANVLAGAVSARLQAGEQLTLKDLLYCMLTGSANDAAAVIAEHIGGDAKSFVALMNRRAAELGCKDTNFVDPHGLLSENQYTTARDMVRILGCAMESNVFAEIFGAVTYTVPATNLSAARELRTANYLTDHKMDRYFDSRVNGGRTGVANDRTRCVAATAENDNLAVIAVVFGAASKYAADKYTVELYGGFHEISKLLDATISAYELAQVFYEDQILAQRSVVNGDNDLVLVPGEIKTVLIPKGIDLKDIEYRYLDAGKSYTAPITAGTIQTGVEIWYSGKCLAKVDLLAKNSVGVYSPKLGELPEDNNNGLLALYILIPVVLIAVVGGFYLRMSRVNRQKRANRRERDRRRNRNVGTTTKRM